MYRKLGLLALAGSAAAFLPAAPFGSTAPKLKATSGLRLRSGRTSINMQFKFEEFDKKEEAKNYDGPGSERNQINKSDEIGARSADRLNSAKQVASDQDLGSKSGLGGVNSKEGDRDPVSGRLILDPLKIPTAEQGAPGTWAEYLEMRKKKEGGSAKDVQGNVIDDAKPTYAVQDGTWGPPKEEKTPENLDDVFGKPASNPVFEVDEEAIARNAVRAAEDSEKQTAIEAQMAKWMADAAAKKAAGN